MARTSASRKSVRSTGFGRHGNDDGRCVLRTDQISLAETCRRPLSSTLEMVLSPLGKSVCAWRIGGTSTVHSSTNGRNAPAPRDRLRRLNLPLLGSRRRLVQRALSLDETQGIVRQDQNEQGRHHH